MKSQSTLFRDSPDVVDAVAAQRRVTRLFADVPLLSVDISVARRCAEIRAFIQRQGKSARRRAFDLVIAATVLEHDLELVTHNAKDFRDIPGLVLHEM